jgi:hypothetical protein
MSSLVNKINKFKSDVDKFNKESIKKKYNYDFFLKNAPKKGEMSLKPYTEDDFIDEDILDEQEAETATETSKETPPAGETSAPAGEEDAGALGDMVIPEPSAGGEMSSSSENVTQADSMEGKSEVKPEEKTDVKSVQQEIKVDKMADKTENLVGMVQSLLDNLTSIQSKLENIPNEIDKKIEDLRREFTPKKNDTERDLNYSKRNPFPYDMTLNDLYPEGRITHSTEKMLSMRNINPNYSDQQIRDSLY